MNIIYTMNPKIENRKEIDDILTFTLSGVDVSFANAIRRVILSEIPIIVFKTMPYEQNKSNITIKIFLVTINILFNLKIFLIC